MGCEVGKESFSSAIYSCSDAGGDPGKSIASFLRKTLSAVALGVLCLTDTPRSRW